MKNQVTASIMGDAPVIVSKSATLAELSASYTSRFKNPIVLAKVNNELQELHKTLVEDCAVEFLDITDQSGFRAYQRGLVMLMIYAVKSVLGRETRVIVGHSINKNYYCEIEGYGADIAQHLEKIKDVMTDAVKNGLKIEKVNIPIEEARAIAKEFSMHDKIAFLKYRRASNVNLYKIDWFYDYFYGPIPPDVSVFRDFELVAQNTGFILQFPSPGGGEGNLNPIKITNKISYIFAESRNWSRILKVSTVGELNGIIASGGFGNFIRTSEALHEKKIGLIADMVLEGRKKIILIAGPSSSGKTTFAERLSIHLRVNGLKPHIISLDNYFKGREDVVFDEFGKPDYEAFDYMNTELLNADLVKLFYGEKVDMPTFDFHAGQAVYKGNYLRLLPDDVLILEGIHGLNEALTYSIARDDKFKIFISALTQLSIDDHNRIPTTDTRLVRRIIRDYNHRGMSATRTIGMWPSVSRGEVRHIFPYQEEADTIFNSALVYELCILKHYAEPLLFGIEKDDPNYAEARRLIKFLDSFLGMSSEEIPHNSILREFIGGSCFNT